MDWVACVGIDWADRQHAYAVREAGGGEYEGSVGSDPESVHEWIGQLRQRYREGWIVVGLEQSRGPLLYALACYDFLMLVPINPRAASSYRDSLRLSGAKDDPVDARLIRDFVATHLSKLRVWKPEAAITRKLRLLCEARRKFVDRRTALTHELSAALKSYFPQALEWFGGEKSALLRTVLKRWPMLEQLRQARGEDVRRIVQRSSRKKSSAIDELLVQIRSAVTLTEDQAIVQASSILVQSLVSLIDQTNAAVRRYDALIAELWTEHPDRTLFESFPGAGPVLAPRLAVAFGNDRSRYAEDSELQKYSGIAPVIEASGKQHWVHCRWQCPKFLRQTFHEFAECSIPHCSWARAFYHQQRERGAGHHEAIRALAFRWIRILFRCWKENTPYVDQRYLEALRRHGSPLVDRLAA
jgi:transposase